MRHAESLYNRLQSDWKKQQGLERISEQNVDLKFCYDYKYIDADITDTGREQAILARNTLRKYDIKVVITSPFTRAVRTSKIAMQDHPSNPNWIAYPWVRETIHSNCDLALKTLQLEKEYPDIDFSHVDIDNPIWFLDIFSDTGDMSHRETVKKIWGESQNYQALLDYMKTIYPTSIEGSEQASRRVEIGKVHLRTLIKDLIKDQGIKDNQILIVAHSNFLQNFQCGHSRKEENIRNGIYFKNAEVREFEFDLK